MKEATRFKNSTSKIDFHPDSTKDKHQFYVTPNVSKQELLWKLKEHSAEIQKEQLQSQQKSSVTSPVSNSEFKLDESQLYMTEGSLPVQTNFMFSTSTTHNGCPIAPSSHSTTNSPTSSGYDLTETLAEENKEFTFGNLKDDVNMYQSQILNEVDHNMDDACNDVTECMSWQQEDELSKIDEGYPVQPILEENDVHVECSGIQHYTLKYLCSADDKFAAMRGKAILFWRYTNQPQKAWFSYDCLGYCCESTLDATEHMCRSCWNETKKIRMKTHPWLFERKIPVPSLSNIWPSDDMIVSAIRNFFQV